MRRTKYAILLLILSLVLAGCGAFTPSEQELQDSIPTLSLTAGRYGIRFPPAATAGRYTTASAAAAIWRPTPPTPSRPWTT